MNDDFTVKDLDEDETKEIQDNCEKLIKDRIIFPVDSADLLNHYKFDGEVEFGGTKELTPREALEEFLYTKYPFQIFGMAEEYHGAMDAVNNIQTFGLKEKLFETVLISKLKGQSTTATLHFLSKIGCRVRNIRFVEDDFAKWDYCDVVVDVMPEVFQNKPEEKIAIKINREYNQWDETDYSLDSINQLTNQELLKKIFEK